MGCTTSSTKISAEPSNTGGSDPTSKQPPTELLIDKKKKDKKNSIEEEAKLRRSVQGKTENMVREEFDRDITLFYDINNGSILGEGISGSVKICTHRATGIEYALKTLDKTKLKKDALDNLRQEIRIMAQLDHPHIIRLHECFEDKKSIRLILELCTGGELLDRLHAQPAHKYTEQVACNYIHTMLSAIAYLHDHNIVHRDLKLENFLFESPSSDSQLKLIDFGLSQYFTENEIIVSPVGTPYYVAPEVLTGAYNNKCDVWSIGVITYMLLSGTPPFYGKDDIGTLKSVKEGKVQFDAKYFSSISNIAKNFIQICLTKNISKRPTAQTLLTHEWFASLHLALESQTPSLNILTRLVLFQKKSELTKLCMEVVAHTLTSKQIENLRIQFKLLDKTNTGEILLSDLKNVLQRQNGISAANLEVMFGGMDGLDPAPASAGGGGKGGGGSGEEKSQLKIKYHEFLAATLSRQNITENNMRVAFEKLSNCHEFITVGDIKDLLGKDGTDEEIKKMLVEVDIDPNNAKISYDNFKTIMLGGDQSPVVNSPYNKYRKQISYGSPSSGGSKKTPGSKSAKKDSLARKAVFNRAMSHSEADSPVRPEVLQFQEEKADHLVGQQLSPVAHEVRGVSRKIAPIEESKPTVSQDSNAHAELNLDEVLPPPSTPPPQVEDGRW